MNKQEITRKQKQAFSDIDRSYKNFLKTGLKNYNVGKDFIYSARVDLKNAILLSKESGKRHRLPLIVYLIQQSVEKYVKAYSLVFGAISKKNMKDKIGHISGKAFIKMLRNQDLNKIFKEIKKVSHILYENDSKDAISSVELEIAAKDTEEMMLNGEIEDMELKEILDGFDNVRAELRKSFRGRKIEKEIMKGFTPIMNKVISFVLPSNFLQKQKGLLLIQYDLLCFLYPMVFITPIHMGTTRYPKIDKNDNLWTKDYVSGNLEIVKEIPRLIRNLEYVDKNINKMMKVLEDLANLPEHKLNKLLNKKIIAKN